MMERGLRRLQEIAAKMNEEREVTFVCFEPRVGVAFERALESDGAG